LKGKTLKLLLIAPTQPTVDEYSASIGTTLYSAPVLAVHRLQQYIEHTSTHTVDVFDNIIEGDIDPAVFNNYDYIGFSITSYSLTNDLKLMQKAYETNPSAVLIAGGVAATLDFATIFRKSKVTYVVLGYGERQLLSILNGESDIPGVISRKFALPITNEELSSYYLNMDFSRLNYERYWKRVEDLHVNPPYDRIRTVRLVTSSHCNKKCSFCSVRSWAEMATGQHCNVAMLSAPDLIQLIKNIQRDVPTARSIYFCEDDFLENKQRAVDYMKFAATTGLRHMIQTHSSRIKDQDTIKMLAEGNTKIITLGIESVIPRVLRTMDKQNDIEHLPQVITWCKELGIEPHLLIILFCQDITINELLETAKILRKLIDLGASISINPNLYPYPGSTLYDSKYEAAQELEDLGNHVTLKKEAYVYCNDPIVRQVQIAFSERLNDYVISHTDETVAKNRNQSKSVAESLLLDLLEEIIMEKTNA
jgi:radical SAM superfamily enzyme YgiQ (UPF0313 family)